MKHNKREINEACRAYYDAAMCERGQMPWVPDNKTMEEGIKRAGRVAAQPSSYGPVRPGGNTMDYTTVFAKAIQTLEQRKDRSAWGRGVNGYAVDMLQQIDEYFKGGYISADDLATWATAEAAALNGERDWSEYSWGGSALVYDGDIAAALCTLSELKKTRNGERRPNSREEWLDVQARALHQAFRRMYAAIRAARQEVQECRE